MTLNNLSSGQFYIVPSEKNFLIITSIDNGKDGIYK